MHESEKWKWSCSVVSNSSRPHGLQPTRLFRPWDFPGKSTGVGCHCLLRTRILECVNISSSRGYSQPRDRIHVSYIGRQQILYHWGTWEVHFLLQNTIFLMVFKTFAPSNTHTHTHTHTHTELDYDVFQSEFLRVYPDWDSLSFLNLSVCLLSNLVKVHIISSNIFFQPGASPPFLDSNDMNVRLYYCLTGPGGSVLPNPFVFFYLSFRLDNLYWSIFEFTGCFLCHLHSATEPTQWVFKLWLYFLVLIYLFGSFLHLFLLSYNSNSIISILT